jgi:hypothetical protein
MTPSEWDEIFLPKDDEEKSRKELVIYSKTLFNLLRMTKSVLS